MAKAPHVRTRGMVWRNAAPAHWLRVAIYHENDRGTILRHSGTAVLRRLGRGAVRAMAWIESHQSLLGHRKTGRISRRLGISKVTAIGHLHCLWWWCLDNADDGDLTRIDVEDIAEGACWEGDAQQFLDALIYAEFVDRNDDGVIVLHDWMDFAGKLVEKRRSDARRKREARHSEDVRRTSSGHPADGAGTVPNLTVPDQRLCRDTQDDNYNLPASGGGVDGADRDFDDEQPAPDDGEGGSSTEAVSDTNQGGSESGKSAPKRTGNALVSRDSKWPWLRRVPAELVEHANRFEHKFYPEYPRHEDVQEAWKAWKKLAPEWTPELSRAIWASLQAYKRCSQWTSGDPQKIPLPATWLNKRRWEGEPPPQEDAASVADSTGGGPVRPRLSRAQEQMLAAKLRTQQFVASLEGATTAANGATGPPIAAAGLLPAAAVTAAAVATTRKAAGANGTSATGGIGESGGIGRVGGSPDRGERGFATVRGDPHGT